jgi:hypothetical protein
MKKTRLIVNLNHTLTKHEINKILNSKHTELFNIKELIDLTFNEVKQVAFRAAWILENIYISYPDRFIPTAVYFLDRFTVQDNLSCRRHYGKILALMTSKKASPTVKEIIDNYQTDHLVETVFSWLIDQKVPVAIKSHGLNILANLSAKHPWIKEELLATMDFLVDKESVGFYSKVKLIRKQLK